MNSWSWVLGLGSFSYPWFWLLVFMFWFEITDLVLGFGFLTMDYRLFMLAGIPRFLTFRLLLD